MTDRITVSSIILKADASSSLGIKLLENFGRACKARLTSFFISCVAGGVGRTVRHAKLLIHEIFGAILAN